VNNSCLKFLFHYLKRSQNRNIIINSVSLLSTSSKILFNILLSRLSPYIDEIFGDHPCEFRRNRSTTDQISCIRRILEKKWEYNETIHQLFVDFKIAYDSVRRVQHSHSVGYP
jgi:hypothetical protein